MRPQPISDASYDSIRDFLDAANGDCINRENESVRDDFAHDRDRGDWYGEGCHTGNDVQRMIWKGNDSYRTRLDDLRDKLVNIELAPVDRRRRMIRSDMGDHLDITAVYAGRLDIAWTTPRRKSASGPQRIDICANMLCSGSKHADVLFWRGAAAVVLSDVLETAGYMVRLVVAFGGSHSSGESVSCRITIKDHDAPFDVSSVLSVILPGFFRAIGHAWIAGHCRRGITSPGISVQQGKIEPQEILLSHNVRDRATAIAFINDTLAKINATQGELVLA